MPITRRQFLARTGLTGLGLTLGELTPMASPARAAESAGVGEPWNYTGWEDLFRDEWVWDRVVKSTHFVNCWYQANCSWNVYVKDNIVWREEQVAQYPQTNEDVPDFNPRGCQKGACYSERMYDASRLKYPLKRVGERGEGKWKRVTWDEALDDLAEEFVRVMTEEGSQRAVWDMGPAITLGVQAAAQVRFAGQAGNASLDMIADVGDSHRGVGETFGKIVFERSADDYFNSDLILIWGSNPIMTQIPNAHFMIGARYNGATLITIAPDYSPSSIHSDLWVPVNLGSDAALALAMAKIIIEENLYDTAFVKEQTDLPILVREDNGLLLRQNDLKADGADDIFYYFDTNNSVIAEVDKSKLDLGEVDPALEGSFEVETLDGTVTVRPVFERLKERVADYGLQAASEICGTPPDIIEDLARRFAAAKAACIVAGSTICKYYHGNLIERSQILLFALCGHIGKKGGGFTGFPFTTADGFEAFVSAPASPEDAAAMQSQLMPLISGWMQEGFTQEMISYEIIRTLSEMGRASTSGTMFWAIHGGLLEQSGRSAEWDPYMKRPLSEYLDESLEKKWQTVWPQRDEEPRMLFSIGSNILRRIRAYPLILKHLWPKLTRITILDWRMSSTAMFADYVLPVAGWYERDEHKWSTPLMPYMHSGKKAVEVGEAYDEWRILAKFSKKIGEVAERKGLDKYEGPAGSERSLLNLHNAFTYNGKYDEHSSNQVAADLVKASKNLADKDWDQIQERGFTRFTSPGSMAVSIGNATDFKEGETITPLTHHTDQKMPWPTLTRRIQFYIDHPFYLELDEALPRHKDPPKAGGDHPLTLSGGHTRWSIHGAWRDDALMLQQQRGVPLVHIGLEDAQARGIEDGDDVKVFNDIDSFTIQAKVTRALRPGQLIIYHAWENFQFAEGKGYQNLIPSPLNPVELAGGQFHLRPMTQCLQPGQFDRDTRVDVVKV